MLKVENGQVIDSLAAVYFAGTAGYNIEKLVDAGHITVYGGAGNRWGSLFENDPNDSIDWIGVPVDVGATGIPAPAGSVTPGAFIAPLVSLRNYSTIPATFDVTMRIADSSGALVYDTTDTGVLLDAGRTTVHVFSTVWVVPPEGRFRLTAFTLLPGDDNPANDTAYGTCVAGSAPPPTAWTSMTPMPGIPSGKQVKDGGWLAYDAGTDRLYAAKGNKTSDFYAYNPANDSWTVKTQWPDGIEAKKPGKGAIGCGDGLGMMYAVKGNNTQGFWKYDAAVDSWYQKKDVPLGLSNKKVKGGSDVVYHNGFVYLLKGNKNEFMKYDVANDSWTSLSPAPLGLSGKDKYDKGSWLTFDDVGLIYCHKAKYNELFAYDVASDSWQAQLAGMPFIGMLGKKKKSKDGGSAAFMDGALYALKGGNTQEFWKYTTTDSAGWTELDTMPQLGTTGKKKM